MKINIRNITENEINYIAKLYVSSIKKAFSKFLLKSTINKFNVEEKELYLKNIIENKTGDIFIAENIKNKEIIAYIIYNKVSFSNIEIISFYISTECINSSIGEQLLSYLKKYCAKNSISNVVLWTFKNNIESIKFYRKLGFYETGLQRGSRLEIGQIEVQYLLKI